MSRAESDSIIGTATAGWERSQDRERELRAEVRRLTDIIVEMRREGFTPAPASPGEMLDIHLDDSIMGAIEAIAPDDRALNAKLTRWALAAMREEGARPEDVRERILRGGSPEMVEI